jgi:hypothetical protein
VRSIAEIRFRLLQEAANARLFAFAPSLPPEARGAKPLTLLPPLNVAAAHIRGSPLAEELERLAEDICAHRFPILGYVVETGPEIRWRRDSVHDVESGLSYFRRIPYLNAALAGDHKIIWELNRHQHLVVLAQAWRLTGRGEFLAEIPRQLESWWDQNPFLRGINWASALEVAYRALSWIWVYHLAGPGLPVACTGRLLNELYRHGVYLEHNLSVYFAPNTHLLGEAVVLHALGVLFPAWPRAAKWKSRGGKVVAQEMTKQVRADGSHFEQSSAYHVYATDLFLFHALLESPDAPYRDKLRLMADYLAALSADDGMIPLLGDDDGGRLFHPHGNRRRFGAATLATCCAVLGRNDWPCLPSDFLEQAAWLCGEAAFHTRPGGSATAHARLFPDANVAVLSAAPAHIVVDVRAFGHANAGHSHAHALSVVCRRDGRDILIDPGTYTYVGEPEWRTRFRGTAFHNTVTVDGLDQATGTGPFRWADKPASEVLCWSENQDWCFLDAVCTFHVFRHRRRLLWLVQYDMLAAVDVVENGAEEYRIEQFWHCGDAVTEISKGNYRIGSGASLVVPPSSDVVVSEGWQSELPGIKVPVPVIVVRRTAKLPVTLGAILFLRPQSDATLTVEDYENGIRLIGRDGQSIEFPMIGDPVIRWLPAS